MLSQIRHITIVRYEESGELPPHEEDINLNQELSSVPHETSTVEQLDQSKLQSFWGRTILICYYPDSPEHI